MKKILLIILPLLLIVGCALPIRVTPYTTMQYEATQNVEVMRTKPPDREYIEIAELRTRVGAANRHLALPNMVEKAKQIGADAIILLGEQEQGKVLTGMGTAVPVAASIMDMVGIAIKYK
jgi:hypothetical protein